MTDGASVGTVGWTVEEKNSSTSGEGVTQYAFTSQLSTATGGTNNATLQYLFNTYDSEQLVTTGTCSAGARFLCVWPARVHRPDATNNEFNCWLLPGSNYSFTVTPSLLKFSLNISSWRWNSTCVALPATQ